MCWLKEFLLQMNQPTFTLQGWNKSRRHSERLRHTSPNTPSRHRPFPLLGVGWRWISTLIIQGWVEGLMASTQTGRQTGRLAGRYEDEWPVRFPAEPLFVSWMFRGRGRRAVFRPRGSLKINRRIHRGLSFLSLRLNEVVCAWCVRRGERVSGVMLHFNEVLLAPRSCHCDLTVAYKLVWTQAQRHAGTDGEQGMKNWSLKAKWKHFDVWINV